MSLHDTEANADAARVSTLIPYAQCCVSCGDLVQGVLRPGERLDGPRVRCALCNPAEYDDFVLTADPAYLDTIPWAVGGEAEARAVVGAKRAA